MAIKKFGITLIIATIFLCSMGQGQAEKADEAILKLSKIGKQFHRTSLFYSAVCYQSEIGKIQNPTIVTRERYTFPQRKGGITNKFIPLRPNRSSSLPVEI